MRKISFKLFFLSIQNYDINLGVDIGWVHTKMENKELYSGSSFSFLSQVLSRELNVTTSFTQYAFLTVLQKKFLKMLSLLLFLELLNIQHSG